MWWRVILKEIELATKQKKVEEVTTKERQLREPKQSRVSGDPREGVRIKPSKDHPGLFYLIEAKANRRVHSGYWELEMARKIIAENDWKDYGVVGERIRVDKKEEDEAIAS